MVWNYVLSPTQHYFQTNFVRCHFRSTCQVGRIVLWTYALHSRMCNRFCTNDSMRWRSRWEWKRKRWTEIWLIEQLFWDYFYILKDITIILIISWYVSLSYVILWFKLFSRNKYNNKKYFMLKAVFEEHVCFFTFLITGVPINGAVQAVWQSWVCYLAVLKFFVTEF